MVARIRGKFHNGSIKARFKGIKMYVLRDVLEATRKNGVAVGHFNVSDLVILKGVFAAAQELNVPFIIGASKGERDFLGVRQIVSLVHVMREEFGVPAFLNADHTHSLPDAIESARAGFDAIVFDLSSLPFEENIRETKQAVEALKSINSDILVEGEIGDIGSGSEMHQDLPKALRLTTPEEAREYVASTGVDILAPAVGNVHGMSKSMMAGDLKKRLDIERIAQIKSATQTFLTLHGASGTDDNDLQLAITAGINIVHINTELRVAWRRGLDEALSRYMTEVVPYKILPFALSSVREVASSRLKLFSSRSSVPKEENR
jgi:ketose-bisphosphate aldolase